MNLTRIFFLVFSLLPLPLFLFAQGYNLHQVPFSSVRFKEGFWADKLKVHAASTLQTCIRHVRDSTTRLINFETAAGLRKDGAKWSRDGDDSDVYKAMEGMAYSLANHHDAEIETLMDKWIELVAKAQQPDGYLNTYFTVAYPAKRWTDVGRHEMYCGGHMIEAAVAYFKATGKRNFLNIAIKYADHLDATFGPGKRHWVPGHQEIELALVKLYQVTNERRYLDLSGWLLNERGHGYGVGERYEASPLSTINCQDDVPVQDISEIRGHAVRAMYMFSAMADVGAETGDSNYIPALKRVWEDVVERNMYVTGGIGSSKSNEGFTEDHYLPNKSAYNETCASVGMVFWNSRMSLLSENAKYADVMERSLYNALLAGVSLSGDRFYYVNPLESDGNHHRQRWFGTACCPSNISRFMPSVGNYFYALRGNELFINLFAANETRIMIGEIPVVVSQQTEYPRDGKISVKLDPASPVHGNIKIRIPGWCKSYSIRLNNKKLAARAGADGYVTISRTWFKNDVIRLDLDMPVQLVESHPLVKDNMGKIAVQRGPLVYCIEEADNPELTIDSIVISSGNKFRVKEGKGVLHQTKILVTKLGRQRITFIPYYAWDNREPGKMLVWIPFASIKKQP